jgi:C1A family cysteine protease
MKARLIAVLCLVIVLALGGAQSLAARAPSPPSPGQITLNEINNGGQIDLGESDMLVLRLESNPSTGYSWHVQEMDQNVLHQVGEFEFEPQANMPGAPGTQVLRFVGVSKGRVNLKLAYRRSWKRDVEPLQTFTVQVRAKGAFNGVYEASPLPVEDLTPAEEASSVLALPSSFNWCDQGKCTAIRDQGSCGSCWAFGTVGPFESNILIQDNVTTNLSEQYLVSCNSEGWGCNGGWWAHNYHEWKYVSGESGPGAVYESSFPYVAYDAPCNPPHPHPYQIDDWFYVDGQQYTVPSVAELKQAIYDYGPVSVAVCVNSAFQGYSGGIFTGPSCTSMNHAVVLVGWDDSQGANGIWYLRNSWDTDWGEYGYMRIQYGVSNVGYNASYVVYEGSAPTPTPTPTTPPGNEIFADNFETNKGWTVNPYSSDTATTGMWERANPEGVDYNGAKQLGTTHSGSYDLVTGPLAGSSAGSYDIDGGVTSIRSPNITLPSSGDINLSFYYYLAHYSNSSSADFLRVKVVGSTTQTVFEELGAANNDDAVWDYYSTSLNSFAGQTVYLLVEAADASTASLVEAAIDDVSVTSSAPPPPTPTPTHTPTPGPGPIFEDNFETNKGWTVNPYSSDTATTGLWERANPEETSYSGTVYQLGTTHSGSYDLVTEGSAGSSVGDYDIDGGVTSIRSPNITLPSSGNITLSFYYYLAHYNNSSSDDYLRVKVVGSTTQTVLEELGAANLDGAAWASFNTSLNSFAGQTIYLLVEAADGSGGSLVEAAIDDVSITSN